MTEIIERHPELQGQNKQSLGTGEVIGGTQEKVMNLLGEGVGKVTVDLRGLQPRQIIFGGIPEMGKKEKRLRVISNDGYKLVLKERDKHDGTKGESYYIFVGIPRGEYSMYLCDEESKGSICTLVLNPENFLVPKSKK